MSARTVSARLAGAWIAAALALGLIVGAGIEHNYAPNCAPSADGRRYCIEDNGTGPRANPQPEEDEPGWNCAEMGNRRCGP